MDLSNGGYEVYDELIFVDEFGNAIQSSEGEGLNGDAECEMVEYIQQIPELPIKQERIKRPVNAYILFFQKNRTRIVEENRHLNPNQISQILGAMWKGLSQEEKNLYRKEANALKDAFHLKYPDAKRVTTVKTKPTLTNSQNLKKKHEPAPDIVPEIIIPQVIPQMIDEHGKRIKRPTNSFLMFSKAKRDELADYMKNMKTVEKTAYLGKLWKQLSLEEKKPYHDLAAEAKREHNLKYPNYRYQSIRKSKKALPVDSSSTAGSTPCSTSSEESTPEFDDLDLITPTIRVESDFPWDYAMNSIGIDYVPF